MNYEKGTTVEKRKIIGSIFPEKLTFDGFAYRAARMNEAVRLIYSLDMGFREMKNGKSSELSHLSRWVAPRVSDSNLIMASMLEFSGK